MKFNLATTALCLLSSVSVSLAAPATDLEARAPSDASQIKNAPTEDIWCIDIDQQCKQFGLSTRGRMNT